MYFEREKERSGERDKEGDRERERVHKAESTHTHTKNKNKSSSPRKETCAWIDGRVRREQNESGAPLLPFHPPPFSFFRFAEAVDSFLPCPLLFSSSWTN